VIIPTIWPQDMIELQPLSMGDARAGSPVLPTMVAKRTTNPVLAITLALILKESSSQAQQDQSRIHKI
jgi:hypothetical protein